MRSVEDTYWWFVSRRRMARRLLARHRPPEGLLLDLGAGTGAFLTEWSNPGVGIDFSPEAVRIAHERGLRTLAVADGQAIPLASGSVTAVVALDTLEHIPDHELAAREVARVLTPGGVFVLNVPAYRWLWGPHDVALHHHRRYVRRDVRRVLEQAGLEVEFLSYSVFFLFPLVLLIRLLDKLRRGPAQVRLPQVGPMNTLLTRLQDLEVALMLACPLPWGSSVVAVARKPKDITPR